MSRDIVNLVYEQLKYGEKFIPITRGTTFYSVIRDEYDTQVKMTCKITSRV